MLGWYLTHMDGRIMYVIAWNLLFNKQRQVEQHTGLSFIWNTSINHAVRGSWGKSCVFCVPGLVQAKGWPHAASLLHLAASSGAVLLPAAHRCPALTSSSAGTGYQGYTAQGQKQKSLLCGAEAGLSTFYWRAPGEPDRA